MGFKRRNDMSWFGFEDISLAVCRECPIRKQNWRSCPGESFRWPRGWTLGLGGVSVSYNQTGADYDSGVLMLRLMFPLHALRSLVKSAKLSFGPSSFSSFMSLHPFHPAVDTVLSYLSFWCPPWPELENTSSSLVFLFFLQNLPVLHSFFQVSFPCQGQADKCNLASLEKLFLPDNIGVFNGDFYCLPIQQVFTEHLLFAQLCTGLSHVFQSSLILINIYGRRYSFLQVRMESLRTSAPFPCGELWEYQDRPIRRDDFVLLMPLQVDLRMTYKLL